MNRQQHIDSLERQRVAMTRDVSKMASDARTARGDIGASARRTANTLRDDARGAARNLAGDARSVVSQARTDTASAAKARLREGARKTAQAVDPRGFVREQPLLGVAAGVGAGLLLSMAVVPRRRVVYSISEDVS